jgi:hypothetical protein
MITLLLLLFPDGRVPSPRWRWVAWASVAAVVLVSLEMFSGDAGDVQGFVSPMPVVGSFDVFLFPGLALGLVAAIASVVALLIRYRRSSGVVREQMKWFAYAAVATIVLTPGRFEGLNHLLPLSIAGLVSIAILPIAIGVAVTRYRLYDIDRIISRTLAYAAITMVLAIPYVFLALLPSAVFGGRHVPGWVVAVTTLLVVTIFRPVRARVRNAVDRRFNRERYDAERTIDEFTSRLRDDIDLDTLTGEIRGVVTRTMQPAHVSLWVKR